jgi:Xaa-Pro aminopeptidase
MPSLDQINRYRAVQDAAKSTMACLPALLSIEDSELSIAQKAHDLLRQSGFPDTWYYNCPALVLAGNRSCLSISGKQYQPSEEKIGGKNLISIDLSPAKADVWGDYSRTFAFEFGVYAEQPKTLEYRNGLRFLTQLHEEMLHWLRPEISFHQLFQWTNVRIRESGFVNLDFRSNVGHSLESQRELRQFIQSNNHLALSAVDFFSFEPFIRLKGGQWGFKHEDIFYFNHAGKLERL